MTLPRLIIIEGTDGVGKTTLAKAITDHDNRIYRHAGPPQASYWFDEYVVPVYPLGDNSIDAMVVDRWHLGELVWPPIFGRESLFRGGLNELELCNQSLNIIMDGDILTVILVRPVDEIAEELLARDEKTEPSISWSIMAQADFLKLSTLPKTIVGDLPTIASVLGVDL